MSQADRISIVILSVKRLHSKWGQNTLFANIDRLIKGGGVDRLKPFKNKDR